MKINLNYKTLFNYLIDYSICEKDELKYINIDISSSRNFNWVLDLPENKGKLIIKQKPEYSKFEKENRIEKELHIYRFLESNQDLVYVSSLTPEILHFDESNAILICKLPNDCINLDKYYKNQQAFPSTVAELIGKTLAKLHSETMNCQDCYTFRKQFEADKLHYQVPLPDYISDLLVSRIQPECLKKIPVPSWRFFGILQHSENVRKVITELVFNYHRCCLTHNNAQLNKFLITRQWEKLLSNTEDSQKSLIKLIDWEACSWGDPAYDLGKVIAGYFLFWLNSMVVNPAIEIKQSLQLATIPLEVVRPSIVTITKYYISTYPEILENYPEFLKRIIQFAGLALIYQILVALQMNQDMNSQLLIYYYVATQLLCKPEKFISI